eukprot:scaffold318038_cov37-Tisochrysis_lutea.AAC.3
MGTFCKRAAMDGVAATVSARRAGPIASTIPNVMATLPAPTPASASTGIHAGSSASRLVPTSERAVKVRATVSTQTVKWKPRATTP